MPIEDHAAAATKIAAFLQTLVKTGGLRVKYRITAGSGAADPDGLEAREIYVELAGPDAELVTERGGEVLRALEHIAAKIIRLEPEEHDKVSFDANQFKALRARELKLTAETAAESVLRTGQPFSFAPMSSRERRMLHLALKAFDDIETAQQRRGPGPLCSCLSQRLARLRGPLLKPAAAARDSAIRAADTEIAAPAEALSDRRPSRRE